MGDLGVLEHINQLAGDGVLIQAHRNGANRLRGGDGPVHPRAVRADDGDVVAALQTLRRKAAGYGAHLGGNLAPGEGLPDAEILLAHGGTVAAHLGMVRKQAWKGVRRDRWHAIHVSSPDRSRAHCAPAVPVFLPLLVPLFCPRILARSFVRVRTIAMLQLRACGSGRVSYGTRVCTGCHSADNPPTNLLT